MKTLYHIVEPSAWTRAGAEYRPDSLTTEGFVHCSYAGQVARVANLFYRDAAQLALLVIDPARLTAAVRDEDPGTGELFPHVYGPIERQAVIEVLTLERDADGNWQFRA
jgi:glutathione S-transferase